MEEKDVFNDESKMTANWMGMNKVGDKIFGTLMSIRSQDNKFKKGEKQAIYEIKADGGEYHKKDDKGKVAEEATEIKTGEYYNVTEHWTFKGMQHVNIGQKVGFKFTATEPSKTKGNADMKIEEVFLPKNKDGTPKMDEEYLKELEERKAQEF